MGKIRVSEGNQKLGRSRELATFSMSPVVTCPGATDWCLAQCYAQSPYKRYQQTQVAWSENAEQAIGGALPDIPDRIKILRFHVSGDFFSAPYIRRWIKQVKARPDVQFWGYTHSWRVPRLRKALAELRDQPNVQLFASVDPSSEQAPDGWRVAFIEGDDRYAGPTCPEQTGQKKSCLDCGYCFTGKKGNIRFLVH